MLEGETTKLDIDRANLQRRLQEDHRLRSDTLTQAILAIAGAISRLYDDRTGRFVVEATDNGPEFRISIEGDRGGGISNIEIFCFDLALFMVVTARYGGPSFLLHDSHLSRMVSTSGRSQGRYSYRLEATAEKSLPVYRDDEFRHLRAVASAQDHRRLEGHRIPSSFGHRRKRWAFRIPLQLGRHYLLLNILGRPDRSHKI